MTTKLDKLVTYYKSKVTKPFDDMVLQGHVIN